MAQVFLDPRQSGLMTVVTSPGLGIPIVGPGGAIVPDVAAGPGFSQGQRRHFRRSQQGISSPPLSRMSLNPRKSATKKEKPAQLPMTLGLVGGGLMFVGASCR